MNNKEDELKNTNDYELIMLFREDDENAKNILFYKYRFIIDILMNKYKKYALSLNIDYQELLSECNVGFSDGLRSFQEDKDTSLPTFLTLCIERRINNILRKYQTDKYKAIKDTYSLDTVYEDYNLLDFVSNEDYEPLKNMMESENYKELVSNIKESLTSYEYEVFTLLLKKISYQDIAKILNKSPKQVDNAIQRIKNKIKTLVNS